MGEHHALGVAGGAGGVQHREVVVRGDGHRRPPIVAGAVAQLFIARPAGQGFGVTHRDQRQAVVGGQPLDALVARAVGEHHPGAAVVQAVGQFLLRPPGVHRHRHRAQRRHRQNQDRQLRIIAHGDRHRVALAHAQVVGQGVSDAPHLPAQLGVAPAFVLVDQGVAVPIGGGGVFQQHAQVCRGVGEYRIADPADHRLGEREAGVAGGDMRLGVFGRQLFSLCTAVAVGWLTLVRNQAKADGGGKSSAVDRRVTPEC